MTNELKARLELIVNDVFAPDDAAQQAISRVRSRRRVVAGAIALVVAGVLIAIPILITGHSDSQGPPATLVPTVSPTPSLRSLAPPGLGSQKVTPLTPELRFSGSGIRTVDLGPRPTRANSIVTQLFCLSTGTFTLTGGAGTICDASDLNNPQGPQGIQYPYSIPLSPGQRSLTITAASGARWQLTTRYAVTTTTPWGVNASGQTYGIENGNGTPDLIAVSVPEGKTGYVYSSEFGPTSCPQPANPAQALAWQDTSLVTVHVPVYLSDGKTRIGQLNEQTHEAYVQAEAECPQPHPTPSS